jgi:receptor protein-tyrosine kinase
VDLNELIGVLWRRKWTILGTTVALLAVAVVALRLVTPVYESTSTIALSPTDADQGLIFFGISDAVVPVYADAATSGQTLEEAESRIGDLAEINVQTFSGTPIIKINARDPDRVLAQQSAQAVTEVLLERAEEDIGISSLQLVQIDQPTIASDPVFPRTSLTIAVALLLGLALGIGLALLQENLTTKVATPEELGRVSGAPVYGEIPTEPALAIFNSPGVLSESPRLRGVSEALRELRTNLLFSEGSLNSLVVTSPEGSHGKTTIAFGLAVTVARAGTRTVLVDGDLRRGRVSELLQLERSPGLMEVLKGAPLSDVIRTTSLETLDVVTGGHRGGDPGELLTSEFPAVLEQLQKLYETVIVDATPLVPISDARIMARYAGSVIVVANAATATRRQVRRAVERLSLISLEPTAVVLNNYKAPGGTSYYELPEEIAKIRKGRRRARLAGRR